MAERELAILVRAKDLASKTMRNIGREGERLGKRIGTGADHAAKTLKTLGTVAAGVAAAGLLASVKAASDFESQMNTINTVARQTPKELATVGKGIRQIAKDTGTPLEELTQGFYDLVSAGVAANQAQRVLAASNRLAIGGLATAAEGVDLITTALNSYGIKAKQQGKTSEKFADIFAKAIERGKVTAAELAESFAQVGGIAASSGISIEELAAGYAQLTAKGVPAAEAATQMRAAMISLIRTTGPMEKLQKQTGRNYAAIASRKGLVVAFEQLRKDAKEAGVPMIELVGRQEALQFALNTTGKNLRGYNQNLDAMKDSQGTAAAQMAERQKGLNFQLQRLGALARDAGITIGSKLLPKITPLAERAVKFLSTHEGDIERFGDEIAKGFEKALAFAEKIPWGDVGAGLKTGAQFAGDLVDVFNRLPSDVKATIVALAGLNKVSGGAVSGIITELGKGLIKGVLGMTAAVVNIKAATVTGVGGGGPGGVVPAGGGKGLKGTITGAIKGAIALTIAGAILEAAVPIGQAFAAALPPELKGEGGKGKTDSQRASEANAIARLQQRQLESLNNKSQQIIRNGFDVRSQVRTAADQAHRQGERTIQTGKQQKAAVDASKARLAGVMSETKRETTRGLNSTAAAGRSAAAAIKAKKLSVSVKNTVNVRNVITTRDIRNGFVIQESMGQYG